MVESSPDNSFLTNYRAFYNRLCVIQPINIVLVAFYLGAPSSPVLFSAPRSTTVFQNCHFAVKVKEITCASCCDIARLFDPKHYYCDNSLLFPKTLDIISSSIYKHNILTSHHLSVNLFVLNTTPSTTTIYYLLYLYNGLLLLAASRHQRFQLCNFLRPP